MTRPILLVEDDSNDVYFMKLAMEKAGIPNSLQVVRDGKEAMAFLRGIGKFADRKVSGRVLVVDPRGVARPICVDVNGADQEEQEDKSKLHR